MTKERLSFEVHKLAQDIDYPSKVGAGGGSGYSYNYGSCAGARSRFKPRSNYYTYGAYSTRRRVNYFVSSGWGNMTSYWSGFGRRVYNHPGNKTVVTSAVSTATVSYFTTGGNAYAAIAGGGSGAAASCIRCHW